LRDQVVIGIAGKALAPGEALPSVRRMAADIGINVHTVNKAYTILRDEGYIVIDRRSGCYISPEPPASDGSVADGLIGKLLPIIAAAICHHLKSADFSVLCEKIFAQLEGQA